MLAHSKIYELYEIANQTMSRLSGRVGTLEESVNRGGERLGYPSGLKSLVPVKHMVPTELNKVKDWERWKIDLDDYFEASVNGLKEALKA